MSHESDGAGAVEASYPAPTRRRHRPQDLVPVGKSAELKAAVEDGLAILERQVSERNLRDIVETLAAFPTRHTASRHLTEAAAWIEEQFRLAGQSDVSAFEFTKCGLTLRNVVCRTAAGSSGAPAVIVCAHFDSRMQDLSDADARAPGADDNATGVAVLLELARVLAASADPISVIFLATSGEEQGLWGAAAYAAHVQKAGVAVRFVLNLDEVGFPNTDRDIVVERDLGNAVPDNDKPSQDLAARVAQAAVDRLGVRVKLGPIERSDYMPFEARGYVTMGLYESGTYPQYHTSDDTPDRVDYAYLRDMARVALAAILCP